jgi:tripartite-type tricarboxylate transporter receptor subunit TctC
MKTYLHFARQVAVAMVLAVPATAVHAQPALNCKQLTIIAPFSPGDSADLFARAVAKGLGEKFGVSAIVENRAGAGSTIGIGSVAKATPDGCTLVVASSSLTTTAAIQPSLPYDPVKSFAPVAKLATGWLALVVGKTFPATTPAELVALLKAGPGKYTYASSGVGTVIQFTTEMFLAAAGATATHVPYRGVGPALIDLADGRVDMMIAGLPTLVPQIESGRVRAIGVTSPKALRPAPGLSVLPALADAVPGYEASAWWGLLAPAGTPPAVVDLLNREINALLLQAEVRALFERLGVEPAQTTPAAFAATIADDMARWRRLAEQRGIKPE